MLALSSATSVADAGSLQRDVTTVNRFADGSVVPGSSSVLTTNLSGATMTLHTSQLPPGHAITVWWVIFNNPDECTAGVGGLRCGEGDLFDPDVDASVVFAAGHLIGRSGKGNWGGWLGVGDTDGEIWGGPGLINPLGADIHLVVHDHGVVPPTMTADAIRRFGPCFLDDPGPDGSHCADLQFAAHEQL